MNMLLPLQAVKYYCEVCNSKQGGDKANVLPLTGGLKAQIHILNPSIFPDGSESILPWHEHFHVARHLGGTRSHLGNWHTKSRARDAPR
jgi:hypothetical protein